MITEDFCSYEVAKLLKEKGFDEQTRYAYTESGKADFSSLSRYWNQGSLYACPTHQMAMKWLREVYKKHCDIGYDIDLKWFFQIIDLKETVEYDYPETKYYHSENETNFKAYEEAVEAALKYVLENLI